MAARAALNALIGNDAQMQLIGLELDSIYSSNATDTPPRDRMFAVVHWDEIQPRAGGLSRHSVSVWFHVPREMELDYGKIDLAILRMKELAKSAEQIEGEDGWVLTGMSWQGASPDLPDDGYNSLTRYASLACACRNVA